MQLGAEVTRISNYSSSPCGVTSDTGGCVSGDDYGRRGSCCVCSPVPLSKSPPAGGAVIPTAGIQGLSLVPDTGMILGASGRTRSSLIADTSKADLSIWRPSTGMWLSKTAGSNWQETIEHQWGAPGDLPLSGDFDGDGKADLVVWRPETGVWYIRTSENSTTIERQWGISGDIPLSGDFDGDGKTDLVLWRPPTGYWYIKTSSSNWQVSVVHQWGLPGDIPRSVDIDGDGKADLAVWRPSTGYWYIKTSSSNWQETVEIRGGENGDIPLNSLGI